MQITIEGMLQAIDAEITGVSTDTRTLKQGNLFLALSGANFDGHQFISEAYQKGASHFIISNFEAMPEILRERTTYCVVQDTLTSYGDLAMAYRARFTIPAIAITGSSGKTTVKELLWHLLSCRFRTLKNRGTENNLVGVPKTLFGLNDSYQYMVLELGTNRPGEIARLASITKPQMGILTQIGFSHLEGLGNREGVRVEKMALLDHLEKGGTLIVNAEDDLLSKVTSDDHKVLYVSFPEKIQCDEKGSVFQRGAHTYESKLVGRHNVLNCLMAIEAAEAAGVPEPDIREALKTFEPVAGRLNLKTREGILFLDDSYNSNPQSFRSALETLKGFYARGKKIVVCGDMLELGEEAKTHHRQIGAMMAGMLFDAVIATGSLCAELVEGAIAEGYDSQKIYHAKDSRDAGRICREMARAGDAVLVKGSRGMRMEQVLECFELEKTTG